MKFTLVYVLLLYSKRGLALLETSGYKTRCASASRAVHCQRSWPVATAGASSNEASSFFPGYLGSLLLDGYAPRYCNSSSHNLYDGGNLATTLLTTMICQATAHWPSNLINMRRVSWRATMEAFSLPSSETRRAGRVSSLTLFLLSTSCACHAPKRLKLAL